MYALSLKSKKLVSVAWLLCGLFVNIQKAFAGDVVSQNFFGNTGGGGSGSQYAVCDNDGWTKNGNTSAVTCYGHVYRNPELGGRNTLGYDDYIQQTFPLSAESGYFDMTVYVTALRTWPHGSHFEIWADDVRVYESAEIDMWDLRTCRWNCGGWTHDMGVFTEYHTGCTDPSGAYVFNIQFAHASAAKEVTIKITTTGLTVNNPGYYYDSWWSLNTFAYTYYAATVTSAFSDGLTVFDREFDFDIKVASGVCDFDTTDCFQTENYHSTNSAKGWSCAVKVTKTLNEDGSAYASGCSTYSNELPCMQWNDFIDTTKASDYVYSLSTEDSSGSLMAGTYDITYECSWTLSGSQVSNTGEQHLLTFSIFHGCDDYLPTTAGVRVQDIFLLSSPEFLVAKAGSVDIVKENVFRSFDTNPLDGTLSYDELKTALETHDVDTGYLEKLNAQGGIGNGVMLSDVMNSATLPFDQTSKTSKVYIDSIVYPKDSTYSDAVCTQNNEKVSVSWDYTSVPSDASDIMCIYVDGRLFSEHVGSDTGGIPFSLSDERPSSGTGDNAVTLVAHFTFDAEQVTNIASSALSASTGPSSTSGYENFESCDPGGYCLKASTASTGYDYEDANSMANSAVMTWLYRHGDLDGSNTASDVIYAMSATDAANSFSFVFELDQSRLLNAGYKKSGSVSSANDVSVSIASSSSLTTGEWHHVAFVSNSKFGLTIYADGANVGNIAMTSWSTAYMDMLDMYATKTLMHSVYTAIDFTYDDLRIYTGILSDLHVNSIYVCGREAYCTTSMAEAKPQSRRTYCPVIKYSSDGSSASACATGLYYDGLAIDVTISASTKGAVFSFRDSALYESAFEVRRREIVSGTALYDTYDSVVLIDSDLSGCSKTFNSLTFYDSLAMATPGSVWEYLITTKYGDVNTMTVDSDPVTFTVPWYGIAEGSVVAGKSDVPVANIRVCARLISSTTVSSISVGTLSGTSLSTFASNRYVEHSNGTQSSSAYMATDDFPSTSVELASEEWIRVDLNNFISVTQVDVKIKGDLYTASTLDVRVLDYDNEDDAGDSGMRCVESANDPIASTSTSGISYLEITYKCTGTHVGAFPGRYITVLSTTDVGVTMDISNVAVTGEEIECPYTSFSDDDGNYEIEIEEESGATSKNAKVGVMAFKTVVFDRSESTLFQTVANDTDTSIVEPDAVLVTLEYTGSAVFEASLLGKNEKVASLGYDANTTPSPPPPPSPPPSPFIDTDVDNSAAVSKEEFSVYAAARLEYVDAFIVIPDAFWNTFDVDSSGDLSSTEFMNVVAAFHSGSVVGTPWLVYPLVETNYLTNFYASDLATTTGQSAIAAAPNPNTTMPVTTTSWQIWYENVTASYSNFSFASPSSSTDSTDFDVLATLGVDDEPEINPAIIPMVVRTDDAGRIVLSGDEVSSQVSGFDALFSASFPIASVNLKLIATEQLYDVVHVFNTEDEGYDTEQSETITKISHLSIAGVAIQDNTVVTVSGMVRFPDNRTSDVVCGLPYAVISAYKQQCGNDGWCTYEEADEYTADVLGYFEISVTPGESYLFHASYGDHSICYSEDGFDAECSMESITTMTLGPSEDTVTTNSYVVLEAIDGSESIVFYDTTERTVDVGLYAGACGTSYEGYTMLITPANGCGAALSVADTDISGWTLTDTSTPNIRYWPYAAMDYYIQLDVAPSVSALTETVILSDSGNSAATCTTPGSNILTFFRDRDELVRTLGFLDTAYATATYQYHGYLCANPTIGSSTTYKAAIDWPLIDADETCLNAATATNPLTSNHMIGTSSSTVLSSTITTEKYAWLQVFEAHCTSLDDSGSCVNTYCSTFSSETNTDLSISVRLKEDVEPQLSNLCHSSNEPNDSCYFNTVNETTQFVQFTDSAGATTVYRKINAGSAKPNLVSPYRRSIFFTVVRNDGWSSTTTEVERELVALGSKVRGESSDYSARYTSSKEFYATAPIRGLVYTVVHDPPGGDSYASIAQGTNIELELGLLTTRSANVASSWCMDAGVGVELKTDVGISIGSGYLNGEVDTTLENSKKDTPGMGFAAGIGGGREEDGPSVSVSATTDNGWDFHMTLNRNLDSSLDPALAGRPGDVLLGGGFEIVYEMSDDLDLDDGAPDNCLAVTQEVVWSARKPTSYIINVFTIEDKILPELEYLRGGILDGTISNSDDKLRSKSTTEIAAIWADRLTTAITDWTNTIDWTTPDFNPASATNELLKKDAKTSAEAKFANMADSFTSNTGVFGARFKEKIDKAYGAYTKTSSLSDYTFDEDWDDLEHVWDSMSSSYGRVSGLSGLSNTMGVITEDVAKGIVDGNSENSYANENRWKPAKGSWVETYQKTGTETGKNVFNSEEPNKAWSRGMNDLAIVDALENGLEPNTEDSYGTPISSTEALITKMQTMDMIDSSVFGMDTTFDFGTSKTVSQTIDGTVVPGTDPASEPNLPSDTDTTENVYLTFSGGGHALEFSSSVSDNIDSWGYEWSLEAESEITNNMDIEAAAGLAYTNWHYHDSGGKSVALEHAMAWAKYGELETSYTLSDPDHGDKFVIQVKFDKRFGTPIFQTIGGASKCPGEPNTMWREQGLELSIAAADGINNEFIAPDASALFDITITNESPYREGQIFGLLLASGSNYAGDTYGNMKDLNFIINGNDKMSPMGDLFHLHDIPATDDGSMSGNLVNSVVSLRIERGAMAHSYESIGLTLISECEWALSRSQIYRAPISHTAYLGDIKWEKKCPSVTWDEGTWNTYANYVASTETSNLFNVTLMNPDPMNLWSDDYVDGDTKGTNHLVHEDVQFIRLQFRRPGTGEWISAWEAGATDSADLQCSQARGEGCSFEWDLENQYFLNGLKDGPWEIRAKVFCSGYDSFATTDVRGSVTDDTLYMIADVTSPYPSSHEVYGNVLFVDFSEEISCPQLDSDASPYSISRTADCDGNAVADGAVSSADILLHYDFRCLSHETNGRNSWTMTMPISSAVSSKAEVGEYTVTINDGYLTDTGGNGASSFAITESFGCSSSSPPSPPPPSPPPSFTALTDDTFFAAITSCLDTNPVDGLCTDGEFGPMPDWDVSQVTDMSSAFLGRTTFNADISQWSTSSATTTFIMFKNAAAFNQDISGWDVSSVVMMQGMFNMQNVDTSAFNQDIGGWDTSQVTNMKFMFYSNEIFDQDVSGWTGSAATSVQFGMFFSATAFNAKYTCAVTYQVSTCYLTPTASTTSTTSAKLGSSKGTKDASFLSPLNKNTAYYIVAAAAFAFGMVASQMMASFTRDKSNRFVHKEEYRESAPTAAEECLVPLRNASRRESSVANAAYGSSEDGIVVGTVL